MLQAAQAVGLAGLAGLMLKVPVLLKHSLLTSCELLVGPGSIEWVTLAFKTPTVHAVCRWYCQATNNAITSPAMACNLELASQGSS